MTTSVQQRELCSLKTPRWKHFEVSSDGFICVSRIDGPRWAELIRAASFQISRNQSAGVKFNFLSCQIQIDKVKMIQSDGVLVKEKYVFLFLHIS